MEKAVTLAIQAGECLPPAHDDGTIRTKEISGGLTWRAAPGRRVTGVVALTADRPVTIRIGADDFVSPSGARIPASAVSFQQVLWWGIKGKDGDIRTVPEFLFPFDGKLTLAAGAPTLVWVTLMVPENAAEGRYAGRLAIRYAGGEWRVPADVTVLPFKTVRPDTVYAMLYTYDFRYLERYCPDFQPAEKRRQIAGRDAFIKRGRRVVRDMAEHGMNMIVPHSGSEIIQRNGQPYLPALAMSWETARENGMTHPPAWFVGWLTHAQWKDLDVFDAKKDAATLKRLAQAARRIAIERGYSECIIMPADEPDHERKRANVKKLLKNAGKIDGVKWAITGQADTLKDLSDLYDIAIIAGGTPDDWAELKRTGHDVWLYDNNSICGRNPTWSRFVYGFFSWRAGVDGVTSWTYPLYQAGYKNARTDLRNNTKIPSFTPDGDPVTSIVWDAIRTGIDDRRYIDTLFAAIADAKKAGRFDAAARAQKTLDDIADRINPNLSAHGWQHTEYGNPDPKNLNWKQLDAARDAIINAIIELKGKP